MMKEERRRQQQHSSTGQQLVLGCILIIPQAAREPHPISFALFLSPPPGTTRVRRPLLGFADQPCWYTTETQRYKSKRTEDGPPLQSLEPCPFRRPF